MKYLISYLPREYNIKGILIPKKGYTQEEREHGKREAIAVTDEQLVVLNADPIFSDYLADKKMRILDKAPESLLSGAERIANLQDENQRLKAANKDSGKVEALETEIATVKEEAIAKVNELTSVKEEAIAKVNELSGELTSVKEEAIAEIDKLAGENAALKARLAELEKVGK